MLDAAAERFADKPAVVFRALRLQRAGVMSVRPHDRFGAEITLRPDDVADYARRAGDLNPIHHDPRTRRARASRGRSPAARRRPGCSWGLDR